MFSLSACAPKPVQVYTVHGFVKCEKPNPPYYRKLDNNYSVGHSNNLNSLVQNVTLMSMYVEQLEEVIDCYETQVEKKFF